MYQSCSRRFLAHSFSDRRQAAGSLEPPDDPSVKRFHGCSMMDSWVRGGVWRSRVLFPPSVFQAHTNHILSLDRPSIFLIPCCIPPPPPCCFCYSSEKRSQPRQTNENYVNRTRQLQGSFPASWSRLNLSDQANHCRATTGPCAFTSFSYIINQIPLKLALVTHWKTSPPAENNTFKRDSYLQ